MKSFIQKTTQRKVIFGIQKRSVHDVKVTLKFNFDKDFQAKIEQAGKKVKVDSHQVSYYDRTEGQEEKGDLYELSGQDTWLQKVDGKEWRCRAPHQHDVTKETHLEVIKKKRTPKYRMLSGEKEIRRELNIQQDITRPETCKSLDEDLSDKGIIPFATIKKTTTVYEMEDGSSVELNETDFGYSYGSVQKMCTNAKVRELKQSVQELEQFVQDNGATMTPYIKEDVEEYIHKNIPTHFEALVEKDILVDQL